MSGFEIEGCRCVRDSGKAILVESAEDPINGSVWVPQSQVHEDSEVYQEGDEGTLVVSEWWAEQQGWM
ncbi:MAG: hypothetical protein WC683_01040 [bacterium]